MKIIAVGMNYALHDQELGHTSINTHQPSWKEYFSPFCPSIL